jgi:hypothetical protein
MSIIIPVNSSEPNRCPNCNKKEKIIEVCKHCGYEYEYEDDDSESTDIAFRIFLTIILIMALTLLLIFLDWSIFDSRFINQIAYKKECDYNVPKPWLIRTNGNYYIIQKNDDYKEYLQGSFSKELTFPEIEPPSVFMDSCKAKRCLKLYLEKNNPLLQGYK